MSAPVKTSACVDCATPIIGDRLRCPACHAAHADRIVKMPVRSLGRILLAWMIIVEILAMVACGFVLTTRGC